MNQQREQEALCAAQREQELREQEQAAPEKEEPPQNSYFRKLIGEICGTKVCEEQKQNMEDTMLELLKIVDKKSFIVRIIIRLNVELDLCITLEYSKKSFISLNNTSQISSINAIPPVLPTEEPEYSLSVRDEHLSTIPKTESDEVIKSSVKNLVPILGESKVTSDNEKFSGKLAHNGPIPPRIEEADFDLEEEILLDDFMPSGIKNDDYDSEGDIYFLEELLSDDPFTLPKNESFNFDHHDDPLFSHPPPEPPDIEVFFEPDTGVLTAKVVEDIFEHYVVMPKVLPYQTTLCLNIDTLLPFSFKNKDKVFKPGILSYLLVSHRDKTIFKSLMMMYGGDIPHLDIIFLHFYPP
nr:hypothetical protein [Tanacetum cinerariifolium]